jgi:hypothetical protein
MAARAEIEEAQFHGSWIVASVVWEAMTRKLDYPRRREVQKDRVSHPVVELHLVSLKPGRDRVAKIHQYHRRNHWNPILSRHSR